MNGFELAENGASVKRLVACCDENFCGTFELVGFVVGGIDENALLPNREFCVVDIEDRFPKNNDRKILN